MPQNVKKKAKIQAKVTKKTVTSKTAVKKPVAKKPVAKKAVVKKPVAKTVVAKKSAVKAPVAKKAEVTKIVAKAAQPVAKQPEAPKQAAKAATPAVKAAYKVGHHVVYPTHGVGKIVAEETQMIGDIELRMLVIAFEKDKMTLRVPVSRATAAGLRPVSSTDQIKKVFVACGRAAPRNTKQRSTPAISSRSPKWSATCTRMLISPSVPTPSA